MTKRERQYINWRKFWERRRRRPKPIAIHVPNGYSVRLPPSERIRVPDTTLIKMGRKQPKKLKFYSHKCNGEVNPMPDTITVQ